MAVLIATHLPIIVVSTKSGNQEAIQHYLEAAGQTFKAGTPVELNASGNTIPWDGTTILAKILGITMLPGLNLTTAGQGASPDFGSIGFPGGSPTVGSVVNQPGAVNLTHGTPFTDGTTTVQQNIQDTVFEGQVDASSGSTYNATVANIGVQYGLTADANGQWYVDLAKTTVGTNTVLTIVSLNPQDLVPGSATTQQNNGRVRFLFLPASSQV